MHFAQIAAVNAHYGIRLEWAPIVADDFSHYSVHMSTDTDRNYKHLGNIKDPSFSVLSVQAGTYHFVIYAHDINGNTSAASDEVTYTVVG